MDIFEQLYFRYSMLGVMYCFVFVHCFICYNKLMDEHLREWGFGHYIERVHGMYVVLISAFE